MKITYIEERTPLGTGGALFFLKGYVEAKEDILLLYGDVFWDIFIERMYLFHQEKRAEITAFIHPNSHPFDSDIVEVDRNGKIINITEKDEKRNFWFQNLVNAALYIIRGTVIHGLCQAERVDFEKVLLRKLIFEEKVFGYCSTEYVKDAGTEERLIVIEKAIRSGYVAKKNLKFPQKCIFLDRDGTINKLNGLVFKLEQLELIDGVGEAIREINQSEYLAILITNQPVVARGLCSEKDVSIIHRKLSTLLGSHGAYLDDMAYCPHHPDKGFPEENLFYKRMCDCRKPKTGMIDAMVKKYHIDCKESWLIGDTTTDIMTGNNAGIKTALVMTGESGKDKKYNVREDLRGQSLKEIVGEILKH